MFTESISDFFDPNEFADTATLTPGGAGYAMYDANGTVLQDFGVQTIGPTLLFAAAQWPAAAIGNTVSVRGRSFRLRSVTPLEDGAIVLAELAEIA